MSPTIRHKYKYFHSTVQRAKDRRQKFHFCRLPFDVRPLNVKLNLSIVSKDFHFDFLGIWFPRSLEFYCSVEVHKAFVNQKT